MAISSLENVPGLSECKIPRHTSATLESLSSLHRTYLIVLLFHMSREVVTGIVDVDKSPIDDGDRLNDVLETLTVSARTNCQSSNNILNSGRGSPGVVYSRQVMTVLE